MDETVATVQQYESVLGVGADGRLEVLGGGGLGLNNNGGMTQRPHKTAQTYI